MRRALVGLFCLMTFLAAGSAFAQRTTGDVSGLVKDDSGAVLPGVSVTVKGEKIVGQSTVTNNQGLYRFSALPPGNYELTFSMAGFGGKSLPDLYFREDGSVQFHRGAGDLHAAFDVVHHPGVSRDNCLGPSDRNGEHGNQDNCGARHKDCLHLI